MSDHKPTPWGYRPVAWEDEGEEQTAIHGADIIDGNGKSVFTLDIGDYLALDTETARRIVASVNACQEFETDFLEKIRVDVIVVKSRVALVSALYRAEEFIAGFEDDELQEGVTELLAEIRAAQGGAA